MEFRFFVHLITPPLRYSGGVIRWIKNELQTRRMHRKVKTMNKELHPRNDTARIYLSRKKDGRGPISCKAYVCGEESNLSWCVRNSEEVLLRKVGEKGAVKVDEAKEPKGV